MLPHRLLAALLLASSTASIACTTTTLTKRLVIPVEHDRFTSQAPAECARGCTETYQSNARAAGACLESCPGTLVSWDTTCDAPDVPTDAMCYLLVERTVRPDPEGIEAGLRIAAAVAEVAAESERDDKHEARDRVSEGSSSTSRQGAKPKRSKRIERASKKQLDQRRKRTPAQPR